MLNFGGLVPSKPKKFFFAIGGKYHVSLKLLILFPNKSRATHFPNDIERQQGRNNSQSTTTFLYFGIENST